jgi:hypothetical protein
LRNSIKALFLSKGQLRLLLDSPLTLRPGRYSVSVFYDVSTLFHTNVTIEKNKTNAVEAALERIPREIRFSRLPAGATLMLNNSELHTNTVLSKVLLSPGLRVTIEAPDYKPLEVLLLPTNVAPTIACAPVLDEENGTIAVSVASQSPISKSLSTRLASEARWTIVSGPGSRWQNRTNSPAKTVTDRVGEYGLLAWHRDFQPASATVLLRPVGTNVTILLRPLPATLTLTTIPPALLSRVEGLKDDEFATSPVVIPPGTNLVSLTFWFTNEQAEFEPETVQAVFEPNTAYINKLYLQRAGMRGFTNLCDQLRRKMEEGAVALANYGGTSWVSIKTNFLSVSNKVATGALAPAAGSKELADLGANLGALIQEARGKEELEERQKTRAQAIRLATGRASTEGFLRAVSLLEAYEKEFEAGKAQDSIPVLLHAELESAVSNYVRKQIEAFIGSEKFEEADQWLAALPQQLTALLPPGFVSQLLLRVSTAREDWVKRRLRNHISVAIQSLQFSNAYVEWNAYLARYPERDERILRLRDQLDHDRLDHWRTLLRQMVRKGPYDLQLAVGQLDGFTKAGGNLVERNQLERLLIDELLDKRQWSRAREFVKSLAKSGWSEAERAAIERRVADLEDEGRILKGDPSKPVPP